MNFVRRNLKRILTDVAGYGLILGGIPLVVGGLGLLSINNMWAKRLRIFVLDHAGKAADVLFPKVPWIEWAYDILVVLLFTLTIVLEWRHASIFQMGLGVS